MAGSDLTAFLAQAGRKPFAWGSFDCLLYTADWVALRCGIDPAAELRGTYDNQRAARTIMLRAGGIERLMGQRLAAVGWEQTWHPQRGDVGLARVPLKQVGDRIINVPIGAICVAPALWAVKPADHLGLIVRALPILRAWTASNSV